MNKRYWQTTLVIGTLGWATASTADTSPWLPIPQTVEVSVSHVTQESTKFFRGTDRRDLPFGSFDQTTTWVGVTYGFSDKYAIDFRAGATNLDAGALGETDDTNDFSFGVTRSLLDESEHGTASVALRLGAIVAGGYDVGRPNSIGDGSDGLEATLAIGKALSPIVAVAGDVGLRVSADDVPTETSINFGLHIQAAERVGLYAQYQLKNSNGDLDIGGEGFTPAGFPETAEEYQRLRIGTGVMITPELQLDLSVYDTRNGRNTADFGAINLTLSYTIDLFVR